jgi:hypothetical protein
MAKRLEEQYNTGNLTPRGNPIYLSTDVSLEVGDKEWAVVMHWLRYNNLVPARLDKGLDKSEGVHVPRGRAVEWGHAILVRSLGSNNYFAISHKKDDGYKVLRTRMQRIAGFMAYCLDGFKVW